MADPRSGIIGKQAKIAFPGEYDHLDDADLGERLIKNPIAMVKFQEAMKKQDYEKSSPVEKYLGPVANALDAGVEAVKPWVTAPSTVTPAPTTGLPGLDAIRSATGATIGGVYDAATVPADLIGRAADYVQTGGANIEDVEGERRGLMETLTGSRLTKSGAEQLGRGSLETRIAELARGPEDQPKTMAEAVNRALRSTLGINIHALQAEPEGMVPGQDKLIKEGFAEANPNLNMAERIAAGPADLAASIAGADPLMPLMGISGGMAGAGKRSAAAVETASLPMGLSHLDPRTVAMLERNAAAGKTAEGVNKALAGIFAPTMAVSAGEMGGSGLGHLSEGRVHEALPELSEAATSGYFALGSGRHLAEGVGPKGDAIKRAMDRYKEIKAEQNKPAASSGASDPALTGMRVETAGTPTLEETPRSRMGKHAGRVIGYAGSHLALPGLAGWAVAPQAANWLGKVGERMGMARPDPVRPFRSPIGEAELDAAFQPKQIEARPNVGAEVMRPDVVEPAIPGGAITDAELDYAFNPRQTGGQPNVGSVVERPVGMDGAGEFGRPLNEFEQADAFRALDEGMAATQAAQAALAPPAPLDPIAAAKQEHQRLALENRMRAERLKARELKAREEVVAREDALRAEHPDLPDLVASLMPPKGPLTPEKALAQARKTLGLAEPAAPAAPAAAEAPLTDAQAAGEIAARDPFQTAENVPAGEVGARLGGAVPEPVRPAQRGFQLSPEEQAQLISMLAPEVRQAAPGAPERLAGEVAAADPFQKAENVPAGDAARVMAEAGVPEPPVSRGKTAALAAGLTEQEIADLHYHPAYDAMMEQWKNRELTTRKKNKETGVVEDVVLEPTPENAAQARAIALGAAQKQFIVEREAAKQSGQAGAIKGAETTQSPAEVMDQIVAEMNGNVGAIRARLVKNGVDRAVFEPLLREALQRRKGNKGKGDAAAPVPVKPTGPKEPPAPAGAAAAAPKPKGSIEGQFANVDAEGKVVDTPIVQGDLSRGLNTLPADILRKLRGDVEKAIAKETDPIDAAKLQGDLADINKALETAPEPAPAPAPTPAEPPKKAKRVNLKRILADPAARREMMVETIIATQAREGIETTRAQAEAAYDRVMARRGGKTIGDAELRTKLAREVKDAVKADADQASIDAHNQQIGIDLAKEWLAEGRITKEEAQRIIDAKGQISDADAANIIARSSAKEGFEENPTPERVAEMMQPEGGRDPLAKGPVGVKGAAPAVQAALDKVAGVKARLKAKRDAKNAPAEPQETPGEAQAGATESAPAQAPAKAPGAKRTPEEIQEIKGFLDSGDYKKAADLARKTGSTPAERTTSDGRRVGFVHKDGSMVVGIDADGMASVLKPKPKPTNEPTQRKGAGRQYSMEGGEYSATKHPDPKKLKSLYATRERPDDAVGYITSGRFLIGHDAKGKVVSTVKYTNEKIPQQLAKKYNRDFKLWEDAQAAKQKQQPVERQERPRIAPTEENRSPNVDRKRIDSLPKTDRTDLPGFVDVKGKILALGEKKRLLGREGELEHMDVAGGPEGLRELVAEGYIRWMPEGGSIQIGKAPTEAQYKAIRDMVATVGDNNPVFIDLSKGPGEWTKGRDGGYYEPPSDGGWLRYDNNANPAKVVGDIRRYYEGEGFKSGSRYSMEGDFGKVKDETPVGPKTADRTLLRTMTAGQQKSPPGVPREEFPGVRKLKPGSPYDVPGIVEGTPRDPRTKSVFPEGELTTAEANALHIQQIRENQPRSKGERMYSTEEVVQQELVSARALRKALPKPLGDKMYRDAENGSYVIDTPRGTIRIFPKDRIEVDYKVMEKGYSPAEIAAAKAGKLGVAGESYTLAGDAVIDIVKTGALPHELAHVFLEHFASAKERALLDKKFTAEAKRRGKETTDEIIADAYRDYFERKQADPGWEPTSAVGKFIKKAYDFVQGAYRALNPNAESVFEGMRTGKSFERTQGARRDTGMASPTAGWPVGRGERPNVRNYAAEGPRAAGSALGRQLEGIRNIRQARPGVKGVLETQKTDMTPRIGKKNPLVVSAEKGGVTVRNQSTVATKGAYAPRSYSMETIDDTVASAREYNAKTKEFTEKQLSDYEANLRSVGAQIHNDPARLGYKALKGAKVLKPNGDPRYPVSQDFTTNCRRRYVLRDTIDSIVKARERLYGAAKAMLGPDEIMQVRADLEAAGHEVNCGPCYVESRRINLETAVNKAIEGYDFKQGETKMFRQLTPENAVRALTQEGRDWMFENDPAQYDVMSGALAGSNIKAPLGRAAYTDEYLKLSQETIDKMNEYSGARSQSWSDMEVPHALDKMQAVLHQALRRLKGQAYTKEIEYVELMKDTNEAINQSWIPQGTGLDAQGNLIWNKKQSIRDMKRAMEIREKYDNVGNEAIGVTDAHILKLLDSGEIDYIIPNHASGLAKRFQRQAGTEGWKDYSDFQSWKRKDGRKAGLDPEATAKEDYRVEVWDALPKEKQAELTKAFEGKKNPEAKARLKHGKEMWEKLSAKEKQQRIDTAPVELFADQWKGDLNKMWELAEKRGVVPPFPQFKDHPNYHKLLVDRRIFDKNGKWIEQKALEFKFDMNYVKKMLDDYQGGHDKFQADPDVVAKYSGRTPEEIEATRMTTKDVQRRKDEAKAAKLAAKAEAPDMLEQMKAAAAENLGVAEKPANRNYSLEPTETPKKKRSLAETAGNTATSRTEESAAARGWAGQARSKKTKKLLPNQTDHLSDVKTIFEWGAGQGADVDYYKSRGIEVKGYDPNWPQFAKKPEGMADAVTSTYVANVLPPNERRSHLIEAYQRAKKKLFVTVRNKVPEGIRKEEDGSIVMLKGEENFQRAWKTSEELIADLKKLFPSATITAGPKLSSGVTAIVTRPQSKTPPKGVRSLETGFGNNVRRRNTNY